MARSKSARDWPMLSAGRRPELRDHRLTRRSAARTPAEWLPQPIPRRRPGRCPAHQGVVVGLVRRRRFRRSTRKSGGTYQWSHRAGLSSKLNHRDRLAARRLTQRLHVPIGELARLAPHTRAAIDGNHDVLPLSRFQPVQASQSKHETHSEQAAYAERQPSLPRDEIHQTATPPKDEPGQSEQTEQQYRSGQFQLQHCQRHHPTHRRW